MCGENWQFFFGHYTKKDLVFLWNSKKVIFWAPLKPYITLENKDNSNREPECEDDSEFGETKSISSTDSSHRLRNSPNVDQYCQTINDQETHCGTRKFSPVNFTKGITKVDLRIQ